MNDFCFEIGGNVKEFPDKSVCGYAGVPVSDVTYRLSYLEDSFYSLETFIGNPQLTRGVTTITI